MTVHAIACIIVHVIHDNAVMAIGVTVSKSAEANSQFQGVTTLDSVNDSNVKLLYCLQCQLQK